LIRAGQAIALTVSLASASGPAVGSDASLPAPIGMVAAPEAMRRAPDQTFLTFPEWFLVYSPAEYAAFVRHSPPSEFPFFGHLRQFWSSYRQVYEATRDRPFNTEYHVMILVIGVSTSVEYALRSAYENVFGRLSALTAPYGATAEDRLAARVAQDYVDFIRDRPWYEFDFVTPLRELWRAPAFGSGLVRKWERRYALTTEYAVKGAYAWLLGLGTAATYGAETPTTAVLVEPLPAGVEAELPRMAVLERFDDGSALVTLPRYDDFKDHAASLAAHGARFLEIAGNRTVILVSAIVPSGWSSPVPDSRLLFTQPLLTQPGRQRVVLVVPVARLADTLRVLREGGHELEHVYDY
jgi:hypothetical protein